MNGERESGSEICRVEHTSGWSFGGSHRFAVAVGAPDASAVIAAQQAVRPGATAIAAAKFAAGEGGQLAEFVRVRGSL